MLKIASGEEAIEIANESEPGLVASLWTQDMSKAWRVAEALPHGAINVNETSNYRDQPAPFGGAGKSGIGRELSQWFLDSFTERKLIVFDLGGPADDRRIEGGWSRSPDGDEGFTVPCLAPRRHPMWGDSANAMTRYREGSDAGPGSTVQTLISVQPLRETRQYCRSTVGWFSTASVKAIFVCRPFADRLARKPAARPNVGPAPIPRAAKKSFWQCFQIILLSAKQLFP